MDDHFDIGRVFEIGKFDITRLTCMFIRLKKQICMQTLFHLSYIEQVKHEAHVQKHKYIYSYYRKGRDTSVSMYLKK